MSLIENHLFNEIIFIAIAVLIIVFVVHFIFGLFKKNPQGIEAETNQTRTEGKGFRSLWLWWVITTFIYLIFNFLGYPGGISTLSHIAGFVGLFVPYGWLSAILFLSPFTWISVVVFVALMCLAEKDLSKKNYSLSKRILINLFVLLLLTFAVDYIRGTFFASWKIFLYGNLF